MLRQRVDFGRPENSGILTYLGEPKRRRGSLSVAKNSAECAPEDVVEPYFRLGTHPEIVERLWDALPKDLPEDCRWVVHGTPALVRPTTGIVFGFAGGTSIYALRLPPSAIESARKAGGTTIHDYPAYPSAGVAASRFDLLDIGPEWIFGCWSTTENEWCLAAYEFAK